MPNHPAVGAGDAWYAADRATFVQAGHESVAAELSSAAASQGWHIETEQHEEWASSVGILQDELKVRAEILRRALAEDELTEFTDVILEYNFRRRGIRIDCILLAAGLIAVLEFKRSKLTPADRDQVTDYCVNLVEFHRETRRLCENEGCIVVPILVMTEGRLQDSAPRSEEFHAHPQENKMTPTASPPLPVGKWTSRKRQETGKE